LQNLFVKATVLDLAPRGGLGVVTGENEMKKLSAALAASVLAVLAVAGMASAAEPHARAHVLPNRLAEKQNALRQHALQQQLTGAIPAGASVAKVGES